MESPQAEKQIDNSPPKAVEETTRPEKEQLPAKPQQDDGGVEVQLEVHVDPKVVDGFPIELARKFNVIPVARIDDRLILASETELNPNELKDLAKQVGRKIHMISSRVLDLDRLLEQVFTIKKTRRKIGEILTEQDIVSSKELNKALKKQETEPKKLGQILIDLGLLSREELKESLKQQVLESSPSFDPYLVIGSRILDLVPEAVAHRYEILPLEQSKGHLVLASSHYLNSVALEEIQSITGLVPKPLIADREDLKAILRQCYEDRRTAQGPKMRIGELLMSRGLLTEEQLNACLEEQKQSKERLGEIIIKLGYVSEESVYSCLADKLGYEYRRFNITDIDLGLAGMIPQKFAKRNLLVPLSRNPTTKVLEVAMAQPSDLKVRDMLEDIGQSQDSEIKVILSSPESIRTGISYVYNASGLVKEEVEIETIADQEGETTKELVLERDMPQIRRVINQTLYSAVVEGASDIHIENLEDRVRVRFRMDGLLQERRTPVTKSNISNIISVLKIDSGLDITERRRPQDGVFKMRLEKERFVDFRISVHATSFGQDAVIRILDPVRNLLPLSKLGFPPKMLGRCHKLIDNPQGLLLVTGPTGSGKSTTLYSMLGYLNRTDKKIVTAEDPVEYYVNGISQYQVNDAIGNTFADYGRRFMRKDPDIILIGEIRDEATAMACLKAAMTGHLVFSTLHTNNSLGALKRLRSLQIDTSFVADALLAVLSQRLVRRICAQCCAEYQPDPDTMEEFYPDGPPSGIQFKQGQGCSACNNIGYRGRLGLYEFWELDHQIRRLISEGASETEIWEASISGSLTPLLRGGYAAIEDGLTTLEELARVIPLDQIRTYAPLLTAETEKVGS